MKAGTKQIMDLTKDFLRRPLPSYQRATGIYHLIIHFVRKIEAVKETDKDDVLRQCLDLLVYELYGLSEAEIDTIADHLELCDDCQRRVELIEKRESSIVMRLRDGDGVIHQLPEDYLEKLLLVGKVTRRDESKKDVAEKSDTEPDAAVTETLPLSSASETS